MRVLPSARLYLSSRSCVFRFCSSARLIIWEAQLPSICSQVAGRLETAGKLRGGDKTSEADLHQAVGSKRVCLTRRYYSQCATPAPSQIEEQSSVVPLCNHGQLLGIILERRPPIWNFTVYGAERHLASGVKLQEAMAAFADWLSTTTRTPDGSVARIPAPWRNRSANRSREQMAPKS